MKKLFLGVMMAMALGLVANVAFTDEVVPFPFWQHGWSIMSFWSIANVNDSMSDVSVTVNMLKADGSLFCATTNTVAAGQAWFPGTSDSWYNCGNGMGYGTFDIAATTDSVYLWSAIYANLGTSQPGYTIVMPANPYGM
jgi:hypothetical protein